VYNAIKLNDSDTESKFASNHNAPKFNPPSESEYCN